MEIRYAHHPEDFKTYTTEKMRQQFLIPSVRVPGEITLVYSHVDRIIAGGIVPIEPLALKAGKEMGVSFFLERRELGIINVGPQGTVTLDGETHILDNTDGLYVGLGVKEVLFSSNAHRCVCANRKVQFRQFACARSARRICRLV